MQAAQSPRLVAGRYLLRESLGMDGHRRVLLAFDQLLARPVVLKGQHTHFPGEVIAELRRLRRYRHPRLATAYDLGVAEALPGIAMPGEALPPFHFFSQEWIPGESLEQLRGTLEPEAVLSFAREALELVAFLHHRGLTRLDLKPAHFLRAELCWRLIDLDQAQPDAALDPDELHGTLGYVAPEVLEGRSGGPHADLYSLGALLYEAMTGAPPLVRGSTLEEIRRALEQDGPPPLPARWLEAVPRLAALVTSLMAPMPAQRPASAEEALELLACANAWRLSSPLPEVGMHGVAQARLEAGRLERQLLDVRGGGFVVRALPQGGGSRFLSELAGDWQEAGRPALLLTEAMWMGGKPPPLELLIGHLRSLAGEAPLFLSEASVSSAGSLVGASAGTSAGPPGLSLQEARERHRCDWLARLLHTAISASARVGQVIPLLIGDMEALDPVSRRALEQLPPLLEGSGLMLVVRFREEVPPGSSFGALPTIELTSLDRTAVRALAEEALGRGTLSAIDVAQLTHLSSGRPGWIREALTLRWRDTAAALESWSPTDSTALAQAMLAPLSATAIEMARAGAVFETPVTRSLLLTVSGLEELEAPLTELVQADVMRLEPGSDQEEGMVRFALETLRRAVASAMPPEERCRRHLRAGEALERQILIDPGINSSHIARHFIAAGQVSRAIPYLQRATDEARRAQRLEEAADAMRQLIACSPPRAPQLAEMHRQLGEVLLEVGQHAAASTALEVALQEGGRLIPGRRVRAEGELGRALVPLGRHTAAQAHLRRALSQEATGEVPLELRIRWWHLLAWLCLEQRDRPGAAEALEQARSVGIPDESRLLVDQVHLEASWVLRSNTSTPETGLRLEAALACARRIEYRHGMMTVLNCLVQQARIARDEERTRGYLDQVVALAHAEYDLVREATGRSNLGNWFQHQGASSEALEQFELAASLHQRLGNTLKELLTRLEVASLLLEHGRTARAEGVLARVASMLEGMAEPHPLAPQLYALLACRLQLRQGHLEGLEKRLEEVERSLEAVAGTRLSLEARADRMELALMQERLQDALKLGSVLMEGAPDVDSERLWERLHGLAIDAHCRLAPRALRPAAGREGTPGNGNTGDLGAQPSHHTWDRADRAAALEPGAGASEAEVDTNSRRLDQDKKGAMSGGRTAGEPSAFELTSSFVDFLQELKRLLESTFEGEVLAAELASLAGRMLSGRGLVFLCEGSRLLASRSYRMAPGQVDDISSTIIEWVRANRTPYRCADVLVDGRFGQLRSLREARVRSIVCHPILRDNACLGVVYVDHPEVGRVNSEQAGLLIARIAELAADLVVASGPHRAELSPDDVQFGLVGTSAPMQRLRAQLKSVVEVDTRDLVVLLLGETGTGKSVIARSIHMSGHRRSGPFVKVNAAAIPDSLFASLMFGYQKGTFTGAHQARAGWFEMAQAGTLFLDEIGEMPLAQQGGMLDTLGGARQFRRLGADVDQDLDAHIVCATSRDLKAEVVAGQFRGELLRRIRINTCRVPTLRERGPEDIYLLSSHMITAYLVQQSLAASEAPLLRLEDYFTRPAQDALYRYPWPWNVGELENLFRNEGIRHQLRTLGNEKVTSEQVLDALNHDLVGSSRETTSSSQLTSPSQLPAAFSYKELEAWSERQKAAHIVHRLKRCANKVSLAARQLGCSRDVVYKYMALAGEQETEP